MSNINKNIIKQAGEAVANATNKAAGLPASTPEPGSIISAIQLVNAGRTIGPAALAHFTESVRNKLLYLLVDMEPIQDLHGYANPWPAGGGVNKLPPMVDGTYEGNGVKAVVVNGVATLSGTATASGNAFIIPLAESFTVPSGCYYHLGNSVANTSLSPSLENGNNTRENVSYSCALANRITAELSSKVGQTYTRIRFYIANGVTISGTYAPMMCLDNTARDFSPYSNICPISGRTRLSVYVGPTSAIGDAATYLMDWTSPAGTVYAGSADIVTGDIKAAPYYASYNGETLVGPWVSSMDEYDPEGTPTTGAQVVDLGGTLTEYHITGQDIITLVGDNYIWSDSGDVTITE